MIRSTDLRDLDLEQSPHEIGMVPREDDLDAAALLAHVDDHAADAFADTVTFARDLLAARKNGFDLAQIDRGDPVIAAA